MFVIQDMSVFQLDLVLLVLQIADIVLQQLIVMSVLELVKPVTLVTPLLPAQLAHVLLVQLPIA